MSTLKSLEQLACTAKLAAPQNIDVRAGVIQRLRAGVPEPLLLPAATVVSAALLVAAWTGAAAWVTMSQWNDPMTQLHLAMDLVMR